jgi:NADH-quinone oxidoreductase subunit F
MSTSYYIDAQLCKGCSKCSKICPAEAISGQIKTPFVIDADQCLQCGACIDSCVFDAIKEK